MLKRDRTPLYRSALCALALGVLAPLAASPALAGDKAPIEVTSMPEMKQWQSDVSRQLDRALERAPGRYASVPDSGVVQVAFKLGEDGRPQNLKTLSNSADWAAERMAIRAVERLNRLAEAPVPNVQDRSFLANIIFADNRAQYRELARSLAQPERARIASSAAGDDFLVLGG